MKHTALPFVMLTLMASRLALAACGPLQPPPEFYVGNTASDTACTHASLQSAIDAATCAYGTTIFVTGEIPYTDQQLTIAGKNLTIVGRGSGDRCGTICNGTCAPPTSPNVAIRGNDDNGGHSNASIFTISGDSHVTLRYLDLYGASIGGDGGAIDFEGTGSLALDTTYVRANNAANGGGVQFNGTGDGDPATLSLLAYTQILNNQASGDGGGIRVAGNAVLDVVQPQTLIQFNRAPNGRGGGIEIVGPADANISSTGHIAGATRVGVVDRNSAAWGGGIAVIATDAGTEPDVHLFATDTSIPVSVTNNTASHTGGGIYLKPKNLYWHANLHARDYRIAYNVAAEGAAIYADVDTAFAQQDTGSLVALGPVGIAGDGVPAGLGAVACTNMAACNTIDGNETTDPTQGSIILIQDSGYLEANRFSMRGNRADHLIRVVGDDVRTELYNGLMAGNDIRHELLHYSGDNDFIVIDSCTFARDLIGTTHVIHAESALRLSATIIDEPGTLALDYSGSSADLTTNYVLSNDTTTLRADGIGLMQGEPLFVDAVYGDYHLQQTSLGVDFAPTSNGTYVGNSTDLDGQPRNIDLPGIGNGYGKQDIGAYELQNLFRECGAADSLFCDGFEP